MFFFGHVGKYSKSHWAFGIWTKSLWTTPNQFSLVSTPLKNISQIGSFPQVGVKIKNLWSHHLAINFDMNFRRRIFRWIPKNCLSDQREGSSLIRKYDSSPNGPVYLTPPKKNHTWMSQEVRKRLVSVGCNPNSTLKKIISPLGATRSHSQCIKLSIYPQPTMRISRHLQNYCTF